MPQKIKPKHVTYITGKDGNVKLQIDHQIDLNLTINLDTKGGIKVDVKGKYEEEKENDDYWVVPEFESEGLIDFGKNIKQEG